MRHTERNVLMRQGIIFGPRFSFAAAVMEGNMEHIVISGGKRLSGEIFVSGSKNAALPIIAAAVCCNDSCIIDNLPDIEDISFLVDALTKLGVKCEMLYKDTMKIDATDLTNYRADFESVRKIRASYYLLGALLGRFKRAEVDLPGGCNFGSRPIDLHIKGFEALGAKVVIEHGMVKAYADKLVGANIYLDIASVGATINIMLAAVYAKGITTIENAAREPHIVDTANFLNMLGAKIRGAGTDIIRITGVESLHGCEYTIIPDQIEAGTYMIASAITRGDLCVKDVIPKHMESVTAKLREMGCRVTEEESTLRVEANEPLSPVNVKAAAYPGFPTDLQPQMCTLLSTVKGVSTVTDTVFDNRFQYVNELIRFGANISVNGHTATVDGVNLTGARVTSIDLRAGVSLVLAGLAAEGDTVISNVQLIDRGYEHIEAKLKAVGACIQRKEE